MSISGDTAIVGAWVNRNYRGAAYVYRFDGTSWVQEQKLTASDAAAGDLFGYAVSIDGDWALVGAQAEAGTTGSAYMFRFNGSSWVQEQKLTASDGGVGDWFGDAVSINGNTALIGANGDAGDTGSAYVFHYDGSSWEQQQKLTASDAAAGDWFATSVSLTSDTALIGSPRHDNFSEAAYLFVRDGSHWVQDQKLTDKYAADYDWFGYSVAIDGGTRVVGSSFDDDHGSASIFQLSGKRVLSADFEAGDTLTITTTTPGGGAGEPVNYLNPSLELYDPSGLLVSEDDNSAGDGRNARITYVVPTGKPGTYQMVVNGITGSGDYTLSINGASSSHQLPIVVGSTPADGIMLAEPPNTLQLTLSEAVRVDTLDPNDLSIDSGATVSDVELLDGKTILVSLNVPDVDGTYTYTLHAGAIVDLQGQPNPEYQASFDLDRTGPRIVDCTSMADWPVNHADLSFSEEIDPATFTKADVAITDPDGQPVTVGNVQQLGSNQYRIYFSPQTTLGIYELQVGPDVSDPIGNWMDQDSDGILGESPDDEYPGTLRIVDPRARILRHGPTEPSVGPLDKIRFEFGRPMDQNSFSLAEDVVSFTGPAGSTSTSGYQWIDDLTLEVAFQPQYVAGAYELIVGPDILDFQGNPMDQDWDTTAGEPTQDQYAAGFAVAALVLPWTRTVT